MARLSDLMNQQPDNGWISMAELDALEQAQRGQAAGIIPSGGYGSNQGSALAAFEQLAKNEPVGQIPGSFGSGQGAFQRSGGNLVNLTPQGWQDTETQQMMAPASGRPNQDVQLDYANPLDYGGAKGYRLKGDSTRALLQDGRMVDLVPGRQEQIQRNQYAQQQAQQKADAAKLDMDIKRATLAEKQNGDWQIADKSGVMINKRTGEIKKMPAGAGGGEIEWKYDAASDEFVAPPTADFPMGRRSGNIAKTNAAKGMDYVINQFRGSTEKPGALENTMQGGWMGIKGLAGKVFDSQDSRRFDNLREQMSTEMRTLFRIPGEGTLSDKEQAQYGIQLPSVTNSKENNEAILQDMEARIGARLDTGANPLMGGGGSQPQAQRVNSVNDAMKLPSGTRFIDPNGVVRVRP